MIIRYSVTFEDLVLYYYNEKKQVVKDYAYLNLVYVEEGYNSLSEVREFWKDSQIIHDDGEE
jgi:hypothetical protein